jgi:hypothetical protein
MDEGIRAGGLLTTETEEIDLGEHEGVRLTGRVERRILRLGLGRFGLRFEFALERPASVETNGPRGREVHSVPSNPDPWVATAQRIVLIAILAELLPRLIGRRPVSHSEGASRLQSDRHGGAHGSD